MADTELYHFWKSEFHQRWSNFWKPFGPRNEQVTQPTAYEYWQMLRFWDMYFDLPSIYAGNGIPLREARIWINIRAKWAIMFLKMSAECHGLNSLTIQKMQDVLSTYQNEQRITLSDDEHHLGISSVTRDFLKQASVNFRRPLLDWEMTAVRAGIEELERLKVRLQNEFLVKAPASDTQPASDTKPKLLTREDILNMPDELSGAHSQDAPSTVLKSEDSSVRQVVKASGQIVTESSASPKAITDSIANVLQNSQASLQSDLKKISDLTAANPATSAMDSFTKNFVDAQTQVDSMLKPIENAYQVVVDAKKKTHFPTSYGIVPSLQNQHPKHHSQLRSKFNPAEGVEPLEQQIKRAVAAALAEREKMKQDASHEMPEPRKSPAGMRVKQRANDTLWKDLATKMLGMVEQGEVFTTYRAMAQKLGIGQSTVSKAIGSNPKLKKWASRNRRNLKATDFGVIQLSSLKQQEVVEPADDFTNEKIDMLMAELKAASTPEQRMQLEQIGPDERRRIVGLYADQKQDSEPSPLTETHAKVRSYKRV